MGTPRDTIAELEAAAARGAEAVLDAVLSMGLEAAGVSQGSLLLSSSADGTLEIVRHRGAQASSRRKHLRFRLGEGIAGIAASERRAYLCADVTEDPNFVALYRERDFTSLLAVPLMGHDRVIAVVCAEGKHPAHFSAESVRNLSRFAEAASGSLRGLDLDTVLTYTKRLRHLESLHAVANDLVLMTLDADQLDPLLARIASDAQQVLGADLVSLYQYHQRNDRFDVPPAISGQFRFPSLIEGPVGSDDLPRRIVRLGRIHYSADAPRDENMVARRSGNASTDAAAGQTFVEREDVASVAAVPLTAGAEVVGVMFVNYRTRHEFGEDDRHVIETFAADAALAIHLARRYYEDMRSRQAEGLRRASGALAHRLRNCLPVVVDRLDRASAQGRIPAKVKQYIEVAQHEAQRGLRLVTEFLTFSGDEKYDLPDHVHAEQFVAALHDAVKRAAPEAEIEPPVLLPDLLVRVNLDRLRDVLSGLARDSLRHSPDRLAVTIRCEAANKDDAARAGLAQGRAYLKVTYGDNGPGIPAEHKSRVFEPFFSTSKNGTGLGLTIARHDARTHGGELVECGEPGAGVRFELYLPASEPPRRKTVRR